jgi:hypothetical protein
MGLEARCQARMGRQASMGKVRLEDRDLVFRGDFKVTIPLAELRRVEARDGALHLEWAEGKVVLDLGDAAARWADKIQHPPSLLDKLGVKENADLPRLTTLRAAIDKGGAVWVIWPKGRKEFREDDVRAYGRAAGLVDVKVARFSDTLSALKMVIPRAQR